jgi:GT2 family glycosyltransferase
VLNPSPLVSIIILSFNGGEDTINCVKSVLQNSYHNFEIIIADNASTDGSADKFRELFGFDPRVKIKVNRGNLGFSKGNNEGANISNGKYLVFLNQDTIVTEDWLNDAVFFLESTPNVGALQAKLLNLTNHRLLDSAGVFLSITGLAIVRGHGEADNAEYQTIKYVSSGLGAALFVRADVFSKICGFDEDFFILSEDGDLCWRVWLSGYKVAYYPYSTVYHKGSSTRKKEGAFFNFYYPIRNNLMMLLKNESLPLLIVSVPAAITYDLLRGIIMRYNHFYFLALQKAISYIYHNQDSIKSKRKIVQSNRKASDPYLLRIGALRIFGRDFIAHGA